MGGSASIESDITIFDADTNDIVTKIRDVNLKKLTLADCRNKLTTLLNAFYFVDAIGVRVLQDDEILLATKVMKSETLDLYIKLEGTALDGNISSGAASKYAIETVDVDDKNIPEIQENDESQNISDKLDTIDQAQEEIDTIKEQANTLFGTSNVDHTIDEIWGALNPPKEV